MSQRRFTLESGIGITQASGPELVIIEQGQGPTKNVVTLTANEMMEIFVRLYGAKPSEPCVRKSVAPSSGPTPIGGNGFGGGDIL